MIRAHDKTRVAQRPTVSSVELLFTLGTLQSEAREAENDDDAASFEQAVI